MATVSLPIESPRPVRRTMRRLRWLVRLYVLLEGLAAIVLTLGSAFWLCLGLDWYFEPSPMVRGVMWCAVIVLVVWTSYRTLFSRLLAPISDSQLALLLERRYPALQESLVTTVEAAQDRHDDMISNAALLRRLSATAEAGILGIDLLPIFRLKPIAWKSIAAAVFVALIYLFSVTQQEAFSFWLQRMQLGQQLWPRRVQLSVVGFEQEDGRNVVRVARDDDLQLQITADLTGDHLAPDRVEIRYRTPEGRLRKYNMVKVGEALPGRDAAQLFRFTFQNVSEDLKFDVIGGDDRLRDLMVEVVERPQIKKIVLDCVYPSYLERGPENVPVPSRVEVAEGTVALCRVECTKELAELQVHDPEQQVDLPTTLRSDDPYLAEFELGQIRTDRILMITARDSDGVETRDPYRIVISMIPDTPPEVAVGLKGIGSAITAQANIPLEGKITDEYGLNQIWYESQVGDAEPQRWELAGSYQRRLKFSRLQSLDLAKTDGRTSKPLIDLKPGTQLALSVHANDYYDLTDLPHAGRSQRFLLDVVTESELRAILEKRELSLRQRFESIYEKMNATRELLQRIEIELKEGLKPEEVDRARQRDRLRVGGCLQNAAQLSHETLGVAEGFEGIVVELENNRIDTEELTARLSTSIATPLRTIAEEMLPDLQTSLKLLESSYVDGNPDLNLRKQSIVQSDAILATMKEVLDRMLELESYNELVALLRAIVDEQQQLQEQTKKERRQKLRDLLGE